MKKLAIGAVVALTIFACSSGDSTSSSSSSFCCGLNQSYYDCSSEAALEACATKSDTSGCTSRKTACNN